MQKSDIKCDVYKQTATYNSWVKYRVYRWNTISRLTENGVDDQLRVFPNPTLSKKPQQQLINQTIVCKLTGSYKKKQAVIKNTWTIPCQDFDRLDIGNKALINLDQGVPQLIKVIN